MSEYIEVEGDYFVCPYCGAKIRINPEIFSENFAEKYPGKTIENIIVQIQLRLKEVSK